MTSGTGNPQSPQQSFWVVVPAAGTGTRMQSQRPKQYLKLAGKGLLEHTLDRLLSHSQIAGLVVAVAEEDVYWPDTPFADDPRVLTVAGGRERCHSVLHGLERLLQQLPPEVWVMVHDVARPCLSQDDLDALITATATAQDGLVLGTPVRDTMKQTDAGGYVDATPDRSQLWHAFTPQVFRLGQLHAALVECLQRGTLVTDEAAAMEQAGYRPQMVPGSEYNIKVTRPSDLRLAELILNLEAQEK